MWELEDCSQGKRRPGGGHKRGGGIEVAAGRMGRREGHFQSLNIKLCEMQNVVAGMQVLPALINL